LFWTALLYSHAETAEDKRENPVAVFGLTFLTDCHCTCVLDIIKKKAGYWLKLFHGLLSRISGENAQYCSRDIVHQTTRKGSQERWKSISMHS